MTKQKKNPRGWQTARVQGVSGTDTGKVYHETADLSSLLGSAASMAYLVSVCGFGWATLAAAWYGAPLPVWYGAAGAICAAVPIGTAVAGVAWVLRRVLPKKKKETRADVIRGDVLCRILGGAR